MMRCWKCQSRDETVAVRERSNLRVLCAACNVDERTSSTRRVAVETRDHNDRYARMAERYGVK